MTESLTIADELRAKLKQAGYNARMVTIRHEHYSMGSSVHATIRSAAVDSRRVRAILETAEDISRDGFGEILSGGNRYVSLHYTDEVQEVYGRRHADAVDAALAELDKAGKGALIPIAGTALLVGWDEHRYRLSLWSRAGGHLCTVADPRQYAERAGTVRAILFDIALAAEKAALAGEGVARE